MKDGIAIPKENPGRSIFSPSTIPTGINKFSIHSEIDNTYIETFFREKYKSLLSLSIHSFSLCIALLQMMIPAMAYIKWHILIYI